VLICDSYNRLALCVVLSDPPRARDLLVRGLETIIPLSDVVRRVRLLNNIGILELAVNRWHEARGSLQEAASLARTAGLIDLWARAALNLGVLAFRVGEFDDAERSLDEALRLGAEVQQTELQLIATYNLGNLARDMGNHRRAGDTYQLAMELAERIGQSEVQAGAMAGLALSCLALDDVEEAAAWQERIRPLAAAQPEWFQGREMVEALSIHLALRSDDDGALDLFWNALARAEERDAYGASWLVAEFGPVFRERVPDAIDATVRRCARTREMLENPFIRERFGVLMLDGAKTVDRA
jgi:tetratricopeptide (TPR) repeat protein